jgi:hypothetical protein
MEYISELPVEFTKPLKDKKVKEKETLTLTCELNKPNKPVKWLKNGEEIVPDDRINFSVDQYLHQLVIADVTVTDADKYTCVCGDVSTKCTIKVDGKLCTCNFIGYAFFVEYLKGLL